MRIEMEEREWQAVLGILAQAPWSAVNPLIMKIGEQMRLQASEKLPPAAKPNGLDREDETTLRRPPS